MRPDKAKVVDEIWDQERIRSFLDKAPMGEEADPDYSVLLYAYRSMRPDDFRGFLDMFCKQGRNLNARSNTGLTLLQTIAHHRKAAEFRSIIEGALA
ncbi:MAG: hypothetical protein CMQ49_11500 [Gammaproteobacteria bacterium]|nr:hypothetical protein [Gammaproteobacteria bacterium]|tara:strand:+ start:589 stop:879 length:291 start_codon:yes stop_codon:yes gene_type:complete